LLLDPNQFDGDIFGGDADDLPDFLVAHVFKPQQDDGSVHHTKLVDTAVELLDLTGVVISVSKEVDVHVEGNHLDTASLFALKGKASVEADSPNPSLYVAFALERVKTSPKVDERLLEKVIGFLLVFRKEVAHGEYRVFVPFDNVGKSPFFFSHVRIVCILDAKKGEILHRKGYFFQKHKGDIMALLNVAGVDSLLIQSIFT
jgi:hypothetical protein